MGSLDKEIGHSNTSVAGWLTFFDDTEPVKQLAWPDNLDIYERMRSGDVQVAAILLAGTLPIRRYKWHVVQEGASDEVTKFVADDLGLPIKGKDPEPLPRRRDRFSHDFHLRHALLSIVFGHAFFEQVYRYDKDADKVHIRKLGPRMQRTISEIVTENDGGLAYIKQFPSGRSTLSNSSGLILPSSLLQGSQEPKIPVDRLVAYVNDREGSHWQGRSYLRPIFGNWTIKDRLIRVEALKHERNGLGVPTIEAPEGATPEMMLKLAQLAMAYKAGDKSGGSLPYGAKLRLVGVEGSLPDTLATIRYHDEQMAKTLLEMFMQLGTTETGSRALGESLVEFFALGQEAIARNYAEVTSEHVIEDLVDLNWGSDEPAPRLGFEAAGDELLAAADLATFVDKGLVVVDEELQEYVRDAYNIDYKPAASSPGRETTSEPDPDEEIETLPDGEDDEDEPKLKAVAVTRFSPRNAAADDRRELLPHEVAAGTNFDALDLTLASLLAILIEQWGEVRDEQLDDLALQIEDAGNDLERLAAVAASALGSDLITPHLVSAAQQAAAGAVSEAAVQGVSVAMPEPDTEALAERARAQAFVLARALSEVASRKAVEFAGPESTGTEIAQRVREHINSLTPAFLEEQFGGSITAAQNDGRFAVFAEVPPKELYASEIRDGRTCRRCKEIDGKTYTTIEKAREDYTVGGYVSCLGGSKCRGTAVAIWLDEIPATVGG